MSRGLHENINSLLKGTSHQGSSVLSVNSVTSDSHKMTLSSHDVTEQAQVTVVDVQTIEIQHKRNLFLHTFPDSLNSKTGKDLTDIIAAGPHRIHITFSQDLHQGCSISLQQPLSNSFKFSIFCQHNSLLVICVRHVHVYLSNGLKTL